MVTEKSYNLAESQVALPQEKGSGTSRASSEEHLPKYGMDILDYHKIIPFFKWDLLHVRLNSYYKAWSYKKRKQKNIKTYRKSF